MKLESSAVNRGAWAIRMECLPLDMMKGVKLNRERYDVCESVDVKSGLGRSE